MTKPNLDEKRGFYIVQLETRDERVVGLFNGSSDVPEFSTHDAAPQANFKALDDLKHRAEVIKLGEGRNGATTITLGVNEFGGSDALTFSQMTSKPDNGKASLVDRFTYRGSSHLFQRTSRVGETLKGQLEESNLISLDA